MEGDECTTLVGRRELTSVVQQEVVGSPMAGEDRDRGALVGTTPDRLSAVAAVLRGKDELLLGQVEVAIRPAVVGIALPPHQLLRRLVGALLRRIKARPVLAQLVAAVHGRKNP